MKNPAYARALIDRRRAGDHPEVVYAIYGNDWYLSEGLVRVAVKPREALGLNWSCVAGLKVILFDRATVAEDPDREDGSRELLYLAAEIARSAAVVEMQSPHPFYSGKDYEDQPGIADVAVFAYCSRRWNPEKRRMEWPAWWSDELEIIHGRNAQRRREEIAAAILA